jgi:hypothetical protein
MAKELGFQPKSLIRNIPAPSQPWKAPVNEWIRSMHAKKFGASPSPAAVTPIRPAIPMGAERRDARNPWPDHPEISDLPPIEDDLDYIDEDDPVPFGNDLPLEDEITEQMSLMLR